MLLGEGIQWHPNYSCRETSRSMSSYLASHIWSREQDPLLQALCGKLPATFFKMSRAMELSNDPRVYLGTEQEFIRQTSCNRLQLRKSFVFFQQSDHICISEPRFGSYEALDSRRGGRLENDRPHHTSYLPVAVRIDGILCQSREQYAKRSSVITGSCHLPND